MTNKKISRIRKVLIIIALCCFASSVVSYLVGPAFVVPVIRPEQRPVNYSVSVCEIIGGFVKKYSYEGRELTTQEKPVLDIVEFIRHQTHYPFARSLSYEAPVAPYDSVVDFGVYLLLPSRFQSDSPVLVGYTTKIKQVRGRISRQEGFYRVGLFLRDNDIIAVALRDYELRKIVGEEKIDKTAPDFYHWYYRVRYLKDKERLEDAKNKYTEPLSDR